MKASLGNVRSLADGIWNNAKKLLNKEERTDLYEDADRWATQQVLRFVGPLSRSLRDAEQALLKHSQQLPRKNFPQPRLRRVRPGSKSKTKEYEGIEQAAEDPEYRGQNSVGGRRPARTH